MTDSTVDEAQRATRLAVGYGARAAGEPVGPLTVPRRTPLADDVRIDIQYCGVCHTDLHTARNDWGDTAYPVVPGHEIVGRVAEVGAAVTRFAVGDLVGVGCLVDSCGTCPSCRAGLQQYCDAGPIGTYNGRDRHSGGVTYGGYSDHIVVDQRFVLPLPAGLDPAAAAPLLCAGVTVYSPMRRLGVGPGTRLGVVGLGGLGHMAVKIGKALGAYVVLLTSSEGKREDGLRLGADEVVVWTDPDEAAGHADRLDAIVDTVAAPHDLNRLLSLLARDGTLTLLGLPEAPHPPVDVAALVMRRRAISGSLIGGLPETAEMLELCAGHGIAADIELIAPEQIETAYARMLAGDVRFRFVIDMARTSPAPA